MNVRKYEDYVKPRLAEITAWCRSGMTEKDIAKRIGISHSSLKVYKKQHTALGKALSQNRERADFAVESALYKRALGYSFEEVTKETVIVKDADGNVVTDEHGMPKTKLEVTKVVKKEMQPDVGAQQFWLKNRKPEQWREKQEFEHTGTLGVQIVDDIE